METKRGSAQSPPGGQQEQGSPGKICEERTSSRVRESEVRAWYKVTAEPVGLRCRRGARLVTGARRGARIAANSEYAKNH